jgi:flavin-binding protein dodecin
LAAANTFFAGTAMASGIPMARSNSKATTQESRQARDEREGRDGREAREGREAEGGSRRERGARTRDREGSDGMRHEHRTAKVVELIGTSTRSFEDAVRAAIQDAAETTRGITGAHVDGFSVRCQDGEITEYKASVKVAFGIERT